MVADAEHCDRDGVPEVIRQNTTRAKALEGLGF